MKFRKVTSSKYIGCNGYSLYHQKNNTFSIMKNNSFTEWGSGFQSVKAAEEFLSHHDYIHASLQCMPISEEDVDLIYDMYCSNGDPSFGSKWYITPDFWIQGGNGCVPDMDFAFIQFICSDNSSYVDMNKLIEKLDTITGGDILASKCIFAAKGNSKSKGLGPNDLTRVKSSNVWAIGVEVNDSNRKLGDVIVQFKGKNGGPEHVYKYYDVPVTLYRRMITTPSKGAFVWKYLRNNFQYSKLTGDKRGKLKNAVN